MQDLSRLTVFPFFEIVPECHSHDGYHCHLGGSLNSFDFRCQVLIPVLSPDDLLVSWQSYVISVHFSMYLYTRVMSGRLCFSFLSLWLARFEGRTTQWYTLFSTFCTSPIVHPQGHLVGVLALSGQASCIHSMACRFSEVSRQSTQRCL